MFEARAEKQRARGLRNNNKQYKGTKLTATLNGKEHKFATLSRQRKIGPKSGHCNFAQIYDQIAQKLITKQAGSALRK